MITLLGWESEGKRKRMGKVLLQENLGLLVGEGSVFGEGLIDDSANIGLSDQAYVG